MGNLCWILCLLTITSTYVCYTQKIGFFEMELGERACIETGTVRELDPIFFFADLHFSATLDIHNWFYFAVYAVDKLRRNPRTRVGEIMLTKCMDKNMMAHKQFNNYYQNMVAGCAYMGNDRIFLAVMVLASLDHSLKDFYGQWHSIDKGFVKSNFVAGPRVTIREHEKLTINDVDVPLKPYMLQLNLDKMEPLKIKYCVFKLNNHTTGIRVGKEVFTTANNCTETVVEPADLADIQIGYQEHEGLCKSFRWRVVVLILNKPKTVKPGQYLEVNYES